jgi:hypothetical protein
MLMVKRKVAAAGVATVLGMGALAPLAFAGDYCPPPPPPPEKAKCNAGNGNGSESLANSGHCFMGDPGNSYNAGNRGGDEIPTSGGVSNPGGNNVP